MRSTRAPKLAQTAPAAPAAQMSTPFSVKNKGHVHCARTRQAKRIFKKSSPQDRGDAAATAQCSKSAHALDCTSPPRADNGRGKCRPKHTPSDLSHVPGDPRDHINTRILHSGSKAQEKGFQKPWFVGSVFWAPSSTRMCGHTTQLTCVLFPTSWLLDSFPTKSRPLV